MEIERISVRHIQKHHLPYPQKLTPIVREEFPQAGKFGILAQILIDCWVNRYFMVQHLAHSNSEYPDMVHLAINRIKRNQHGWLENISWDDLNSIKQELGYGDWWGIEIYPEDAKLVNVANLRHLWILPKRLNIGWGGDESK